MWMMGYADGGDFSNNIQDSINGRRLRPLVPRTATASASTNPPCLFHGSDLFSINHHFAAMVEQNKRELNTQQVVVSSRWNPTPEQLQALEDLYRRGTRTPSAEQIQHITAELRRYGKIEGKNVFYWFQNHKARERQKRRRQLDFPSDEQPQNNNNLNGQKKESLQGANRTTHEVEQANYWASPTNSSTIPAEKTLSRQGASKAEADSKSDGWVQFDDTDDAAADHLQQQQRKNATWQMQNMSCSSSPQYPTNLINSSSAAPTSAVTQPSTSTIIPSPLVAKPNFVNMLFLDKPYFNIAENPHQISPGRGVEAQTLDLFPILGNRRECINDEYGHEKSSEEEDSDAEMINSSNGTHGYQFFEFLPLKN